MEFKTFTIFRKITLNFLLTVAIEKSTFYEQSLPTNVFYSIYKCNLSIQSSSFHFKQTDKRLKCSAIKLLMKYKKV